jgi:hypothetical protein
MPVLFQEDDCVRATMTSLITSKLQLLLLWNISYLYIAYMRVWHPHSKNFIVKVNLPADSTWSGLLS